MGLLNSKLWPDEYGDRTAKVSGSGGDEGKVLPEGKNMRPAAYLAADPRSPVHPVHTGFERTPIRIQLLRSGLNKRRDADINSAEEPTTPNLVSELHQCTIGLNPVSEILPNPDLPEKVLTSVSTILAADSASKLEELQALSGTWDGEKRTVSKHAQTLGQQNNGIRVAPRGWKCEKCDMKENLWLNLTDGSILCGRKFFDGTGGNNHALEHFEVTKHPLAVKLGTITPSGADVYSYDEDEMVEDPLLAQHLAHFGINLAQMENTDKSMLELEIDVNLNFDDQMNGTIRSLQPDPLSPLL